MNSRHKNPKKILLVRTDRLGDTILTLPVVNKLKKSFPNSQISFLCQKYTHKIVKKCYGLDKVIIYDNKKYHRGLLGTFRFIKELKSFNFDTVIIFHPKVKLFFIFWVLGISIRIGTFYRWYSFFLTDRVKEHRKDCLQHEVYYNLNLLYPLKNISKTKPLIQFKENLSQEVIWERKKKFIGLTKKYIIIHPGSGKSAPNLNINQYRDISNFILEKINLQILFTGTKNETELINKITNRLPTKKVRSLAGLIDIEQLFEAIKGADLLISSSTGPIHLADALNTPLLGFYCPLTPHSPVRWGPFNQPKSIIQPELKTNKKGCNLNKCPFKNCLENIPSKKIKLVLSSILDKKI